MKKADKSVLKKWIWLAVIVSVVLYSINGFAIAKIVEIASNNVVYAESAAPILLEFLGEIFEVCAISLCYAILLLAIYKWETQGVGKVFVMFGAVTFYKYCTTVVMGWIGNGSVPLLWLVDLVWILLYTGLELIQLMIIYKISKKIIIKFTEERNFVKRAAERMTSSNVEVPPHAYLFEKVFDKKNCLLKSAYVCALVTYIAKFAGTLISDVLVIIESGFPKESVTWLFLVIVYISQIIFGFMCYFFVYASLSSLSQKLEKN